MTYVTRNLLSYAVGRNAGEQVVFITIPTYTDNGDGSYTPNEVETDVKCRVVDLTPSEIKRLQDKGITMNRGVNVSAVGEVEKAPDRIRRSDGAVYRVMDFTIRENASIFLCDLLPLGEAIE